MALEMFHRALKWTA